MPVSLKASIVEPQTAPMVILQDQASFDLVANASGFFWMETKAIQGAPMHNFFRCIYQGVLWQFDKVVQ